MTNRGKSRPDHFQVEGGSGMDRDRYKEEVSKLKHQETPPMVEGTDTREEIVHAGQTLGKPVMAVCRNCKTEIGVAADRPILPCENCRSTTFRVVKTETRRGEVVHAGQILGRPAMAVCTTCETEVGVKADAAILPCDQCRGAAFRLVS